MMVRKIKCSCFRTQVQQHELVLFPDQPPDTFPPEATVPSADNGKIDYAADSDLCGKQKQR